MHHGAHMPVHTHITYISMYVIIHSCRQRNRVDVVTGTLEDIN